jgi:hypothetical protein
MPRYVFHLQVKPDHLERLHVLNRDYHDDLKRVTATIPGLRGVEKYLVGTEYVELIDYDGEFAEFGKAIGADPAVREFMRGVNQCFVTPLREMTRRRMTGFQTLP